MQLPLRTETLSTTPRSRRRTAALLCVVTYTVGAPSAGYPKTMQEKMEAACAADVARLCAEAKSDEDALKACMIRHRTEASANCLRYFDASE